MAYDARDYQDVFSTAPQQAIPSRLDWEALGALGTSYTLYGGKVTVNGSGLQVDVSAWVGVIDGVPTSLAADTLTPSAATTAPRVDMVVATASGFEILEGAAADWAPGVSAPRPSTDYSSSTHAALARLDITAALSLITSDLILDRRIILPPRDRSGEKYMGAFYVYSAGNATFTATGATTWADFPDQPGTATAKPLDVFIPRVRAGQKITVGMFVPLDIESDVDDDFLVRVVAMVDGSEVLIDTDLSGAAWYRAEAFAEDHLQIIEGENTFVVTESMLHQGGVRLRPQYNVNHTSGTVTTRASSFNYGQTPTMMWASGPSDRTIGTGIITSSQSLLNLPSTDPIPMKLMDLLLADGHNVGLHHLSEGGLGFNQRSAEPRLARAMTMQWERTVAIVWGGLTELNLGTTAATIYGFYSDRAEQMKADGHVDYVIGMTVAGSTGLDSSEDAERDSLNTLLLADANGFFDTVIDVASETGFEDGTGSYYDDGTHFSLAGADAVAALLRTAIEPYLID